MADRRAAAATKRCRKCDQEQPLVEFYPHAGYADGLDNRCRTCLNTKTKSEKTKLEVRIKSRAHNRAMAALKELRRADYERLLEVALLEVRAEADRLGPTARLKTGPAREGETVGDRIRELCADCGTSHERGHTCPHCGASPEHGPTRAILPRAVSGAAAPIPHDHELWAARLRAANERIMRERDARRETAP